MSELPEMTTAAPEPVSSPPVPRRSWPVRLATVAGRLVVAAALCLCAGFGLFLYAIESDSRTTRSADGIVVLTGGVDRVAEAASLLAGKRGRRLLITGVHPDTTLVEIGRTVPVAQSVLDCCAELGRSALNTRGNAIETADWAKRRGFRSLIIVTSAWHMPRALVEMRRAMPDVELLPYPVTAGPARTGVPNSLADLRLLTLEYVKFLAAWVGVRPSPATTSEVTLMRRAAYSPKSTT